MPIDFYRWMHLTSGLLLFLAMGGVAVRGLVHEHEGPLGKPLRRRLGITHGVALALLLISGFGLLAKLGMGFPGWVLGKLGLWAVFFGLFVAALRKPRFGKLLWWGMIILGTTAVYLAVYKPFL